MPVAALGLMAVGMFYLITIIVGLCANRCLSKEDERNNKAKGSSPPAIRREMSTEVELLQLLESSATASGSSGRGLFSPPSPIMLSGAAVDDREDVTVADRELQLVPDHLPCTSGDADRLADAYIESVGDYSRGDFYSSPPMSMHSGDNIMAAVAASANHQGSYKLKPKKNHIQSILRTSMLYHISKSVPGGKFMLAERNIGYILGSFSLLAIRTGGVYSNGIAEQIYTHGLLWCQLPIASSLSLLLGGALFASQMYAEGYVTMTDPFQQVYGVRTGVILLIPVLLANLLFAAVILSSIGSLMTLALGYGHYFGVLVSLFSMLSYLLVGGLYAGTLTDALQFVYLFLGLWLLFPFAISRSSHSISEKFPSWLGEVDGKRAGLYIDQLAVLILGGIPMQSYFQRVLSSKSPNSVRYMTVAGVVGCLVNAVPSLLIGAAARSSDWVNTTIGAPPAGENVTVILPLVMSQMAPNVVMLLCLGALTSGFMASCDSSIFGSATILTQNVYKNMFRPDATDKELRWAARFFVVVVSAFLVLCCILWPHWHHYWLVPYDILYVIVFPQLFCVIHYKYANTYGAISALVVGVGLRLLFGGDNRVPLPAIVPLPFWNHIDGQLFPYRTLAMLISMLTLIFVSLLYHWLYTKGRVASENDVFVCFAQPKQTKKRGPRVTLESIERTTVL